MKEHLKNNFFNMNTILIFGATGTVGVYSALRLKSLGYNVIAVGRRKSDNGFFADYKIPYYSVDIVNSENFNILPKQKSYCILHFAGAMPARMKDYFPHEYIDTVITGTFNVLEFARQVKTDKIIFTQSISDCLHLGGTTQPIPADIVRKFPLNNDHSIYVIAKNAAVDLIEHYYSAHGLKRFILRLPTIYLYHPDPYYHVNGEKRKMFYRQFIEKALKGETIDLWGDPSRVKEIVYVKDFVQIVEKCVASKLDGGFYNVGGSRGVTLEEQIKGIIDIFSPPDKRSKINYLPNMPEASQFIFDISKTKEELGYVPAYSYIDSLKDFKNEMLTQPFSKLWGKEEDYH
jgi:nucleoside-diphosphate-sugar epimerase